MGSVVCVAQLFWVHKCALLQSSVPLLPPPASAQLPFSAGAPTSALPFITIPPPSHGYPIIPGVPMPNTMIMGGGLGMGPGSLGMGPPMGTGFGMMSSPIRPGFGMASPMGGGLSATGPAIPAPNFGMAGGINLGTGLGLSGTTSVPSQAVASTGMPVATPVQGVALPPTGGPDPLAILNDLVVPLESIQQGEYASCISVVLYVVQCVLVVTEAICYMERSIRKWVLWNLFYNIKFKLINGTFYTKMGLVDFIL